MFKRYIKTNLIENQINLWDNDIFINPPLNSPKNILPNFIRSSTLFWPEDNLKMKINLPLSILINPNGNENIPIIDLRNKYIVNCGKCHSNISNLSLINNIQKTSICPICNNGVKLADYHLIENSPEFNSPIYDMIINQNLNEKKKNFKNFLIGIDISNFSIKTGFLNFFIKNLIKLIENLPNDINLSIISFAERIIYYDPILKREIHYTDLDSIELIPFQFYPLNISKDFYLLILNNLLNLKFSNEELNCFGSFLEISTNIMLKFGGIIISSLSNRPLFGLHKLLPFENSFEIDDILSKPKGDINFYNDISYKMNFNGISLNLFCLTQNKIGLSILGIPCGLTSGSCHTFKDLNDSQIDNILFLSLLQIFQQNYFWNSTLELIYNPFSIDIPIISSNGIRLTENKVSLSNLPFGDSILFEISPKMIFLNSITFQFKFYYFDNEGLYKCRIFTIRYPTTLIIEKIFENLDYSLIFSTLTRKYSNSLLTNSINKSKEILNFNNNYIKILLNYFEDTLITKNIHPNGCDGFITEILFLRSFNIENLLLYLFKRYFKINENCYIVQNFLGTICFINSSISIEYLKNTFNINNLIDLPLFLPHLNSNENIDLWNLLINNKKNLIYLIYLNKF